MSGLVRNKVLDKTGKTKTGNTKIYMFYTVKVGVELMRNVAIDLLDYFEIEYEEGIGHLTDREIEILEKEGFIKWNDVFKTYNPGRSFPGKLTIKGGNSVIFLFGDEGEWLEVIKIFPKDETDWETIEKEIVPVLRKIESTYK
ncbi:MAG: hypothetical protein QXN08_08875 [Nitrososphaerales archaeon]